MRPSNRIVLAAVLPLIVAGCPRAVRPDVGKDRVAEAGVAEGFGSRAEGAPEVTWDFGDGSPKAKGPSARHAYSRSGEYQVRALDEDGEVVAQVKVEVVPREVLKAVPAGAELALWIPKIEGNVRRLLAFSSELTGRERAEASLSTLPLFPLILDTLKGPQGLADPQEGYGLFAVSGFDGVVMLLGVTDQGAALQAAARAFEAQGSRLERREDGAVWVHSQEPGLPALLFADRGYLYVAIPGDSAKSTEEPAEQPEGSWDVEVARGAVISEEGEGLAGSPDLAALRKQVAPGQLYMFAPSDPEVATGKTKGFLATVAVETGGVKVDGFLASDEPLLTGAPPAAGSLWPEAGMGPVAAAHLSVPPEELATLIFGMPGTPERERALKTWAGTGVDAEALVQSLRGDVALLAYLDAPGIIRHFLTEGSPTPQGTVLLDIGLEKKDPLLVLVTRMLEDLRLEVDVQPAGDGKRFATQWSGYTAELTVSGDRASAIVGTPLGQRPRGDLSSELQQRFGNGAFGPGHLSVVVDVEQMRKELAAPVPMPGFSPGDVEGAQAILQAMLDQLTPVERVFLDLGFEERGARLKGEVRLRPGHRLAETLEAAAP